MMNIVFDYDGVIDKSMDYQVRAFRKFSWKDVSLKDFQDAFAGNIFAGKIFQWVDPAKYAEFVSEEQSSRTYDDDVKSHLELIAQNNNIAICSSSDEKNIRAALENNGIDELFTHVMGRESGRDKVEKLERLKLETNNYFVTDTLWDIKDGKKAWYTTVWITWWFHERETLELWSPDYIVDSIQEIYSKILNWDFKG